MEGQNNENYNHKELRRDVGESGGGHSGSSQTEPESGFRPCDGHDAARTVRQNDFRPQREGNGLFADPHGESGRIQRFAQNARAELCVFHEKEPV